MLILSSCSVKQNIAFNMQWCTYNIAHRVTQKNWNAPKVHFLSEMFFVFFSFFLFLIFRYFSSKMKILSFFFLKRFMGYITWIHYSFKGVDCIYTYFSHMGRNLFIVYYTTEKEIINIKQSYVLHKQSMYAGKIVS